MTSKDLINMSETLEEEAVRYEKLSRSFDRSKHTDKTGKELLEMADLFEILGKQLHTLSQVIV